MSMWLFWFCLAVLVVMTVLGMVTKYEDTPRTCLLEAVLFIAAALLLVANEHPWWSLVFAGGGIWSARAWGALQMRNRIAAGMALREVSAILAEYITGEVPPDGGEH